MRETESTDQRNEIATRYSNALENALWLEGLIQREVHNGKNTVYIRIPDEKGSKTAYSHLAIGQDLLAIVQGGVRGARRELLFDWTVDETTGKEITVLNEAGKAAIDHQIASTVWKKEKRKR